MKLRKVKLQNIKSYTEQEIIFHEGVNFISGINGAGKTTIIEAIGYALFDYNPYQNIKDLIRYGAKSGTITLDFYALDEREYRIVRKIGTSNLWAVYDFESDSELDLHGNKDVKEWLKEALGVDRDMELGQLFQDIIGVPQGTFVGPFLETLTIRKKKFDSILKVEQYRDAYNNTSKALALLNKNIQSKQTDLLIKAEQVKDFDKITSELAILSKNIEELSTNLQSLGKQKIIQEETVQNLENTKNQLDKTKASIKVHEATVTALMNQEKNQSGQLSKSKTAEKLVEDSATGHQAYIEVESALKALESKRQQKELLEKEFNQLKQEISTLTTSIKERETNIEKLQNEIAADKINLSRQIQENTTQIAQAKIELATSQQKQSQIMEWKQAEEGLAQLKNKLEQIGRDLKIKIDQQFALTEEEKLLNQRLVELPELEKIALSLDAKQKELTDTREQFKVFETTLKTLTENRRQTDGGKCPFLGSDCQNVGGDLAAYFSEQIEQTKNKMSAVTAKGIQLKIEYDQAKLAREKSLILVGDRERLKQIKSQEKKLTPEINHLLQESSNLAFVPTVEQLSRFSDQFSSNNAPIKFKAGTIKEINQTLDLLTQIEYTSKTNRDHVTQEITSEINTRSSNLARLDAHGQNLENNLNQLNVKAEQLQNDKVALTGDKEKLIVLNTNLKQLEQTMQNLQNVNTEISQLKEKQQQFRSDFEIYMQNKAEADKVKTLEQELLNIKRDISAINKTIQELYLSRDSLNKSFNPEQYQLQIVELDKIKQQTATEKQKLIERQKDFQDSQERILEMAKVMQKIEQVKRQIVLDQKNHSLLELVRNTLNNAGPPIARIYLENLSREANELYRQVSRENAVLEWREGYEIVLKDSNQGQQRERTFRQFSGGEQMTAALAVRLALLKQQSRVKVGFFDEPTANLDSERRTNLAETIPHVTGGFDQIFIISHDDTFDEITENIIQIQKNEIEGSNILS